MDDLEDPRFDALINTVVGESVKQKVDDYLRIDKLSKDVAEDAAKKRQELSAAYGERCLICTLACGTCIHTKDWYDEVEETKIRQDAERLVGLEAEIADVMGIIGSNDGTDSLVVDSKPVEDDIDISGMQWYRVDQRNSDCIGGTELSIFSPEESGWNTAVNVQGKFIINFGGLRYR